MRPALLDENGKPYAEAASDSCGHCGCMQTETLEMFGGRKVTVCSKCHEVVSDSREVPA